MAADTQFKPRISTILAAFLILVAILIDIIQLLLTLIGFVILGVALNSLLSFFAIIFFGMIFSMNGVPFMSSRKLAITATTIIAEIIPLLNNIPAWTLSTATIIVMTRTEDKKNFKKSQGSSQSVESNNRRANSQQPVPFKKAA